VIFHIYDSHSHDLVAAFHLTSDPGPELARPGCLLPGFREEARINRDCKPFPPQDFPYEMLIEGESVEGLIPEVVAVGLF